MKGEKKMGKKLPRSKYDEAVEVLRYLECNYRQTFGSQTMAERIVNDLAKVYGVQIEEAPILEQNWKEGQWHSETQTLTTREAGRELICNHENEVVVWLKDDKFKDAAIALPVVLRTGKHLLEKIEANKTVASGLQFVEDFKNALRDAKVL